MLKKTPRVIFFLVLLTGCFCFALFALAEFSKDYIFARIEQVVYHHIKVRLTRDDIHFDLFRAGLRVSNLQLVDKTADDCIFQFDDIFLSFSYQALFRQQFKLNRLEFYGVEGTIAELLKILSDLSSDSELVPTDTESENFNYLDYLPEHLSLQKLHFRDLANYLPVDGVNHFGFLDFTILDRLLFSGRLKLRQDGQIRLKLQPSLRFDLLSAQEQPLEVTCLFNPSLASGHVQLNMAGLSLEQFLQQEKLKLSHSSLMVSLQGEFSFLPTDDERFAVWHLTDDQSLYYCFQGEGRLFVPEMFLAGQLHDLYLKIRFNERGIDLEKAQVGLLGGTLVVNGFWQEQARFLSIHFQELQIADIMALVLGKDLANEDLWGGSLSASVRFQNEKWEFLPISIDHFSFAHLSLPLEKAEVQNFQALPEEEKISLRLAIFPLAELEKLLGVSYIDIDEKGLSFAKQLLAVPLSALEPYLQTASPTVAGLLDFSSAGHVDFTNRSGQLDATAFLREFSFLELPIERSYFSLRANNALAVLTGELILPLGEGSISFQKDFFAKDRHFTLSLQDIELSYPAHIIKNYPLSGRCNGQAQLLLDADFGIGLQMELNRLALPGFNFSEGSLTGSVRETGFDFQFQHAGGSVLAQGGFNFSQLLSLNADTNFPDVIPNFNLALIENNLGRLPILRPAVSFGFSDGSADVTASYDGQAVLAQLRSLAIKLGETEWGLLDTCHCRWQAPYQFDFQAILQGKFADGFKSGQISISASGESYKLKLQNFDLRQLSDWEMFSDMKIQGLLQAELELIDIFSHPRLKLSCQAGNVRLDYGEWQSTLEKISAEVLIDNGFIQIQQLDLWQDGHKFAVHGQIPCVFAPLQGKWQILFDQEWNLDIHLPETPLVLIKQFLPNYIKDVQGYFQGNMQIGGSISQPMMAGFVRLNMPKLSIEQDGENVVLQNIILNLEAVQNKILVRELSGRWTNIDFQTNGHVLLTPSLSWELSGAVQGTEFNYDWLSLKKINVRNILIGGSDDKLIFVGTLTAEQAIVFYEKFSAWLNESQREFSLPFFPEYDLQLRVEDVKKSELRSDFFRLDLQPQFSFYLRTAGSYLDGLINVSGGHINIIRNRFQVEADSYLRFVPYHEQIRQSATTPQQKEEIWASREFMQGSLGRKLSLLWNQDDHHLAHQRDSQSSADKLFDVRLRISAKSKLRNNDVLLLLSGSLDRLDYSLSANDKALSSEDIMRELAAKGVGNTNTAQDDERTQSERDMELISRQVTAQLEDKLLGRHFDDILSSVFKLDEFRLRPHLGGDNRGFMNIRMGASLSDDFYLSHEQNDTETIKSRTQLKYRLDERLNLFWQKERSQDYKFDLRDTEDVQFGFEQKRRF